METRLKHHSALLMSLTASVMACAPGAHADDAALLQKIQQLEKRVAELEGRAPAQTQTGNRSSPRITSTTFKSVRRVHSSSSSVRPTGLPLGINITSVKYSRAKRSSRWPASS